MGVESLIPPSGSPKLLPRVPGKDLRIQFWGRGTGRRKGRRKWVAMGKEEDHTHRIYIQHWCGGPTPLRKPKSPKPNPPLLTCPELLPSSIKTRRGGIPVPVFFQGPEFCSRPLPPWDTPFLLGSSAQAPAFECIWGGREQGGRGGGGEAAPLGDRPTLPQAPRASWGGRRGSVPLRKGKRPGHRPFPFTATRGRGARGA